MIINNFKCFVYAAILFLNNNEYFFLPVKAVAINTKSPFLLATFFLPALALQLKHTLEKEEILHSFLCA